MDTVITLRRLARSVQAALDALYQAQGTPAHESPLNQEGLRNGVEVVNEYVDHNEQGLAFEHLLYMITEPGLILKTVELEELAAVGRQLGFAEDLWARIRTE